MCAVFDCHEVVTMESKHKDLHYAIIATPLKPYE